MELIHTFMIYFKEFSILTKLLTFQKNLIGGLDCSDVRGLVAPNRVGEDIYNIFEINSKQK